MNKTIDLSQPIPPEWRVRGADSHLYSIGLSLFQPKSHCKRKCFYNPILIFIILFHEFINSLIKMYINLNKQHVPEIYHIILVNLDHVMLTGNVFNISIIMMSIFVLSSQLVNYYNYMNGIKPTDLRVFHMISGFISPKSIGINDRKLVIKLCKICNQS